MPGVDSLQIELLPDAVAPRAVRVRLRIRPDAMDMRPDEASPMLALDRRFNLRNARS
jgi:hypothetical protein